MTEATEKTREELLLEQFKDGLDPNGAAALQGRVEALEAERDAEAEKVKALEAALAKARTATAAAKKAAKVAQGPKSTAKRAIGAVPALDAEGRAALLEDLREGPFEVVFSDGKREIRDIAPLIVSGDAWAVNSTRIMLKQPVTVDGAGPGGQRMTVAGFGLVDGKGRQRAWCGLPDAIVIAPGTRVELDRTIAF